VAGSLLKLVNRILEPSLNLHVIKRDYLVTLSRTVELTEPRLMRHFLYQRRLLETVATLQGDIVECGVGYGRSLLYWALLTREEGQGRWLWGFDSFEGFPEPSRWDQGLKASKKGRWRVDMTEAARLLSNSRFDVTMCRSDQMPPAGGEGAVLLVQGFFHESLPRFPERHIALLYIDADLYDSYKDALTWLYPRVVRGGIIAFDEYEQELKWPGAKRAIDEYLGERVRWIQQDRQTGKCYLVKQEG